jgi:hypothetical protein
MNVANAQNLRRDALSSRISDAATRAASPSPADVAPAVLAVSVSSLEEVFHGPSIHVHAAVNGAGCAVSVSAPAVILNIEAFVEELTKRLESPNSFD